MASFGWTWEYIDDHMTLPRLTAILDHQADFPPQFVLLRDLRDLLAQFMGAERKPTAQEPEQASGPTIFDLFPQTPGA